MKGYSSRAFLSNYTAIADSKWWRKLTDTNKFQLQKQIQEEEVQLTALEDQIEAIEQDLI